jgi:hypothetical protein
MGLNPVVEDQHDLAHCTKSVFAASRVGYFLSGRGDLEQRLISLYVLMGARVDKNGC